MFRVSGLDITISRGDTADLIIDIEGADDGDEVVMSLKRDTREPKPIWQKVGEIDEGQVSFQIVPEDTKMLKFGDYRWDIRVFSQDGTVTTPFAPKLFKVAEVVGNDR